MFRLTDEEMEEAANFSRVAGAQMKKLLLGISKETKKLDGTTYLVPDYSKFKEALEEMNNVQTY